MKPSPRMPLAEPVVSMTCKMVVNCAGGEAGYLPTRHIHGNTRIIYHTTHTHISDNITHLVHERLHLSVPSVFRVHGPPEGGFPLPPVPPHHPLPPRQPLARREQGSDEHRHADPFQERPGAAVDRHGPPPPVNIQVAFPLVDQSTTQRLDLLAGAGEARHWRADAWRGRKYPRRPRAAPAAAAGGGGFGGCKCGLRGWDVIRGRCLLRGLFPGADTGHRVEVVCQAGVGVNMRGVGGGPRRGRR